jgi:WD40 repeat protein
MVPNSHLLVSGGGDPFLILWDLNSTFYHQKVSLCTLETKLVQETKSCVTGLAISPCSKYLAVTLESITKILFYKFGNNNNLEFFQVFELEYEPLSMCFTNENLLVTLNNTTSKTLKCHDLVIILTLQGNLVFLM